MLLFLGFFVCGFHVAFIQTHLPTYIADLGLALSAGAWALALIGLFNVAGTAASQGPDEFLILMALLSINLGFVNLLPIPILDGGHLLFFTIEAIRRKPLSQRAREIASAVGLVFILILLLVATRNDIIRYVL